VTRLSYALITPARDEAENLRRLAACIVEQTLLPTQWIIVDNGSTDETRGVAERLAGLHDWIAVHSITGEDAARPGAPVVRAFNAGLEILAEAPDILVKLDADVSVERAYFERLAAAFQTNPSLGIASGKCLELRDGVWREIHVTGGHVRGASRAYRWACLQDVLPLEEVVGWDGIDELKASVFGWTTGSVPGIAFYHHRKVGQRDGSAHARWTRQGEGSRYMGYRFWYLVLRTAHHMRRDRAAIAMILGYLRAAARREPRYRDERVRHYLREQQSLRMLPRRVREALGRNSA
jgi:poly-beta-1,6-N-acetyl-D-glucosamine synthase